MKKIFFAIACAAILTMTGCATMSTYPAASSSFAVAATNTNQKNIVGFKNVESDWMRCDVIYFINNYTPKPYDNIIDISMTVREKHFGGFVMSRRCKFSGVAVQYVWK